MQLPEETKVQDHENPENGSVHAFVARVISMGGQTNWWRVGVHPGPATPVCPTVLGFREIQWLRIAVPSPLMRTGLEKPGVLLQSKLF